MILHKCKFIGMALIAFGPTTLAHGHDLDTQKLTACFAEPDRLDRLFCYDEILNRPQINDPAPEPVVPVSKVSRELFEFGTLLAADDQTEDGVPVTLRDAVTQFNVFSGDETTLEFLARKAAEADFKEFSFNNDLYLAIAADPLLGAGGGLIVSCESNITNMRLVWENPIENRVEDVRILFGESLSQEDGIFARKMRASTGRHMLRAPRGLEAIKILQRMARGQIAQLSIGTNDNIRSLFFEMAPLSRALPLIGQHCGWSGSIGSPEEN